MSSRGSKRLGPSDPRTQYRNPQDKTRYTYPLKEVNGSVSLDISGISPLSIDPARGLGLRVAPPLVVQSGSPYQIHLKLGPGLHLNDKNEVAPKTSSTVRVSKAGEFEAVVTTQQVMDDNGGTVQSSLDRKINTADARIPIARGTATLVAGTVDVALTSAQAGAYVLVNHAAFAGTPGLLSASVTAGVKITITSASILDTSTVFYTVFNP